MFDDYARDAIDSFVSDHPELVREDHPTITRVSQIDPQLDLEDGPIDLLYRFKDDRMVALAFERVTADIYTTRFVADRIGVEWGDEME